MLYAPAIDVVGGLFVIGMLCAELTGVILDPARELILFRGALLLLETVLK